MEIWKDIIGYEGLYQVSNLGRVKSLERLVICDKGKRLVKSIILKQQKKHEYYTVFLFKHAKGKSKSIHRLVAEAFIPNPKGYPMVMHKDNNPKNNHLSNLQWGNQSMNIKHCVASGRWRNQFS